MGLIISDGFELFVDMNAARDAVRNIFIFQGKGWVSRQAPESEALNRFCFLRIARRAHFHSLLCI
jgi:hypothetical protein